MSVPLVAAGLAAVARLSPLRNGDVLWQIRSGEEILRRHGRLTTDLYSFAFRGRAIHDHEAAFEALVGWLHRHFGMSGIWWGALVVIVAFAALSAHAARTFVPEIAPRVVGISIVIALVGARTELRAELATFASIALAFMARRRGLRFAPLLTTAIAAAFHGLAWWTAMVPVAFALTAATERRWREVAVDVAVALAVPLVAEIVSPGLARLNFESAAGSEIIEHINELKTPWSLLLRGVAFMPTLALLVSLVALLGLVRIRAREAAWLVALSMVPGFRYARFVWMPLFAAMPLVIAGLAVMTRSMMKRRELRIGVPAIASAVCVLCVTPTLGLFDSIRTFDFGNQPVNAVDFLRTTRPDAALFHPYNFGSYLIYAGYPPRGVLIDPRAQVVYPNDFVARYYRATSDPVAFDRWAAEAPFDVALLARGHGGTKPLREHLLASPKWKLVYQDSVAYVFFRVEPAP